MDRTKWNYIVDVLMFIAAIPLAGIGVLMEFILPPGTGKEIFWSLSRHEWGAIHWYFAIAFSLLLLIHLVLHWNWFVCTTKSFFRKKKKVCK